MDGCQRRSGGRRLLGVVETDNREVSWHPQPARVSRTERTDGHVVIEGEDRGWRFLQVEKVRDRRLAAGLAQPVRASLSIASAQARPARRMSDGQV
jgi:hypothetical protein